MHEQCIIKVMQCMIKARSKSLSFSTFLSSLDCSYLQSLHTSVLKGQVSSPPPLTCICSSPYYYYSCSDENRKAAFLLAELSSCLYYLFRFLSEKEHEKVLQLQVLILTPSKEAHLVTVAPMKVTNERELHVYVKECI